MIHLIDFQENILRIHFKINYPSITKGMIDKYADLDVKIGAEEPLSIDEERELQICKQHNHMPDVKFIKAEIISVNSADNNIFDIRMYNALNAFMQEFREDAENFESIENIYYQQS